MKNQKTLPFLGVTIAAFIWGLSFLSIKVTVAVLGPMTLGLSRFVIASLLLGIALKIKEPHTRLQREDIPRMIWAGCIGITLYFFFENNGVKHIPASTASLIVAAVPIFTLVADALVLKNPLTKAKLFSVILSLFGVYLVVGGGLTGCQFSGSILGYLLMFGAMLTWVVYCLVTRPLFEKYSKLAVTCYQTLFGTLAFVPFAVFEPLPLRLVNGTIILNVMFLGIFCSALAYYLYLNSLDKLGANLSSLFLNLVPVVGVVASWFVLGERLQVSQMIGGVLVVGAVFIAEWEGGARPKSVGSQPVNDF